MIPADGDLCKGPTCGAPIRWALTEATGVAIPLDYEPNPDGNVILLRGSEPPVARTLGPLELLIENPDTPRYMPHHATCPDVELFRRAVAERNKRRP